MSGSPWACQGRYIPSLTGWRAPRAALDPPRNYFVFSDRVLGQCLRNIGFRDVEFVYPYLGTPYASPARDHARFLARLVGVKRHFAFWRNMMECYARK